MTLLTYFMKRLDFNLEGRLVDAESKKVVNAQPLLVRPRLIGFDAIGITGPNSMDPEYLKRLDQAINQEKAREMLPFEANAYVTSLGKAAGRDQGYVLVAVQFYKTE